ncbi:MAG: GumC family protein, partial [Gemmatimonadota bacterium]
TTVWIERPGGDRGPIEQDRLLNAGSWIELLQTNRVVDPVVREERLYLEVDSIHRGLFLGFDLRDSFAPGTYRLEVADGGARYRLLTEDGRLIEEGAAGRPVGTELGFEWWPRLGTVSAETEVEFTINSPRDVVSDLQDRLTARLDENGNFLYLTLTGPDPDRIARVLNRLTERFVAVAAELKSARLEELTAILERQLAHAERNMTEAEAELERFRVRTITEPSDRAAPLAAGVDMTRDPAFSSFFEMQMEQDRLERDLAALRRVLAEAQESDLPVEALEVIPSVRESSELADALAELTAARTEVRALLYRYTPEHPPVRELQDRIDELEVRTIPRMVRGLIGEITTRLRTLERRIDGAAEELRQIPTRSIEEARLERRVTIAENLYTMLQSRYEEARLAAASTGPDVRVLDAARMPQNPVSNTVPHLILLAILVSLGAGLGLAVLLDRFDKRVRYPDQVSDELGLPILGAVPILKGKNGHFADSSATHQVVEAFREIRLGVEHSYGSAGPVVFAVSSPGPGEGKSFVASNVALAFADLGKKTLLIDSDVRRGSLHHLFDVDRRPGLTDVLMGDASTNALVRSVRPSLDLIASGRRSRQAPELLSTRTMRELVLRARSNYDVIILDSPPLGAGVDPYVLSTLAGSMMLVIRAGDTDRELTAAKLETLGRLPVRMLGAVLNAVPASGVYRYYYSYLPDYAAAAEEVVVEEESEAEDVEGAEAHPPALRGA